MKKALLAILFAFGMLLTEYTAAHASAVPRYELIKPAVHAVHVTNKNSVRVIIVNLHYVDRVTYTLSYTAKGVKQGILGNFEPGLPIYIRSLYLGTCSDTICIPDTNVKDVKLDITYTFSNGKTSTHLYNVR